MLGSWVAGSGRLGVLAGWVAGLAVVVLLLLGGGSAGATTGHSLAGQFGGLGTGDGQFGDEGGAGPAGVGVSGVSGEVFTADAGQGGGGPRVQRFSAGGAFLSGFGIDPQYSYTGTLAVDSAGAGAVYVGVSRNDDISVGRVLKFSAAGILAYELDAAGAAGSGVSISPAYEYPPLAVDPVDGSVYVAGVGASGPVVARFDGATGAFVSSFDGSGSPDGVPFCGPLAGLAVDGLQRVYVLDSCASKGRVDRFSEGGVFEETLVLPLRSDGSAEVPSAVAVDPVSDEVYVAHSGPLGLQITHLSAGGTAAIYTFDASAVAGVRDMAVSGAGTVYTSDATDPFVEWFTSFAGPTVVTDEASPVAERSVTLQGTINPEGVASTYHFEYGTGPEYGKRVPAAAAADPSAGSGSAAVAVSAPVEGLEPNKSYHFRLVGSNASGSIAGADRVFTTVAAPPDVGDVYASLIKSRSARLHGSINPNNNGVLWGFDYGTTSLYGNSPFGGVLSASGSFQPVSTAISGLDPGTEYLFRLGADDFFFFPEQYSEDGTFITAPGARGGTSVNVTAGGAELTGIVDPHGVSTSYHFEYGVTAGYGASTPEADAGAGKEELTVSQVVTGLLADTTYHVRVVAKSTNDVIRYGDDGTFRTAEAPVAVVTGPSGVTSDAATLAGTVNTHGVAGSYHFEVWSLDSAFTRTTLERPAAGNATAEPVSALVDGLPAGERLVVQLTVSSNDAIGVSDLLTFATPQVPTEFPPPPPDVYGCGSPLLNAYNKHPKPGEAITITGQDLGVGGSVMLADRSLEPSDWSPSGFKVVVPKDVAGPLALTINCGRRSNTITVAIFQEPDNRFAITSRSVTGTVATLKVRVPGPGKLESSGAGSRAVKVTIKKPGTANLKVKLTSTEARALGRMASRTRKIKAGVRYTPAGGRPASKTVTITFKAKGAR